MCHLHWILSLSFINISLIPKIATLWGKKEFWSIIRPILLQIKITLIRELLNCLELMFKITQCVLFGNNHYYFRKHRSSHLQIEVFKGHGVFFQEVQGVLGNKTHPEEAAVVMWLLPFYHLQWIREKPLIFSLLLFWSYSTKQLKKKKRQWKMVSREFKFEQFFTDAFNPIPFPEEISAFGFL